MSEIDPKVVSNQKIETKVVSDDFSKNYHSIGVYNAGNFS